MAETRNLCAQIPIDLHAKVMEEKTELGQALSEYITNILKEHFEGGTRSMTLKTLAVQIPEELDQRIKNYLATEKERTGQKLSQKDFVVGLIVKALDEYEAVNQTEQ